MTASPDTPVVVLPTPHPHSVRLALLGDLDYDNGDLVLEAVQRALREHDGVRELRLDCRELRAVDSTGLSVLLLMHRLARRDGIGFHLDAIGPALKRLLDITGTYEHLTTAHPDVAAAESSADATSES
ncbi:STAS domain-containing protein [Streptomyces sp. NPDC032940]|uniref:STAS domain-containing protein n=1 Tax=Streptomyces sp. NPDC032940 TaxID=3155366 RepID=UPI0033DA3976